MSDAVGLVTYTEEEEHLFLGREITRTKSHSDDTAKQIDQEIKKLINECYDEAKKIVLDALKPLGEDYLSHLKTAFENRWIDVYETKGKRSGAYSSGTTFGVHPYVLLNWNNRNPI